MKVLWLGKIGASAYQTLSFLYPICRCKISWTDASKYQLCRLYPARYWPRHYANLWKSGISKHGYKVQCILWREGSCVCGAMHTRSADGPHEYASVRGAMHTRSADWSPHEYARLWAEVQFTQWHAQRAKHKHHSIPGKVQQAARAVLRKATLWQTLDINIKKGMLKETVQSN